MTCRLNFLYSYFLFWEHSLQSEVPSRLFALCNLLGPLSSDRFLRLFPSIYNCSLPELFRHQGSNQWIFNPSCRKSYCLTFTGTSYGPIFYRPFPQGVQISCVMSVRVSFCPSAWNSSPLTERIFMKFGILAFFENLWRKFKLGYNLTRITGTLP